MIQNLHKKKRYCAMETGDHFKNGASLKSLMSRGYFLFVLLAFGVLNSGCKKDDNDKDTKEYYFTPPTSWKQGTAAGGIETFTGPNDESFSPNMSIFTEPFNGTLTAYVDANISTLNVIYSIDLSSRTAFQTNSGLSGERLVYLLKISGINLRYVAYLFSPKSGSKTYVVISGAGLASWNNKYDATFDAAAKTFSWK